MVGQQSMAQHAIALANIEGALMTLLCEEAVICTEATLQELFNQGRLDPLLAECYKRMCQTKPWTLKGIVEEQSLSYQASKKNNPHMTPPVFDQLAAASKATKDLPKETSTGPKTRSQ